MGACSNPFGRDGKIPSARICRRPSPASSWRGSSKPRIPTAAIAVARWSGVAGNVGQVDFSGGCGHRGIRKVGRCTPYCGHQTDDPSASSGRLRRFQPQDLPRDRAPNAGPRPRWIHASMNTRISSSTREASRTDQDMLAGSGGGFNGAASFDGTRGLAIQA